jgi:hypothetical protein
VQFIWEKYYKNSKLPDHIKKGSFWWKDILKLLYIMMDIVMDDANVCDGLWTMDLYMMYYGWWMCM